VIRIVLSLAFAKASKSIAARIAMMAITIKLHQSEPIPTANPSLMPESVPAKRVALARTYRTSHQFVFMFRAFVCYNCAAFNIIAGLENFSSPRDCLV
jgi:hypothetical protein